MGIYIRKSIWDQRVTETRALGTAEALGIIDAADVQIIGKRDCTSNV